MITVDLIDETNKLTDEQMDLVERLIQFAAKDEVETEAEVSVTFVTNKTIQGMNKDYRQKDYATDVLSFAMEEVGDGEIELEIKMSSEYRVLGDIIISIEKAHEQAEEYGHSFERELTFLAIHGFLHLLGYDHETEEDEQEMFTKQMMILEEYGIKR